MFRDSSNLFFVPDGTRSAFICSFSELTATLLSAFASCVYLSPCASSGLFLEQVGKNLSRSC